MKNSIVLIVITHRLSLAFNSILWRVACWLDGDLARDWMEGGTERKKTSIYSNMIWKERKNEDRTRARR